MDEPSVTQLEQPLDDQVVAALVAVRRAADAARDPDDPPVGAAELVPDLFVDRPREVRAVWLATHDDAPVGLLVGGVSVDGENAGYAELEIDVVPGPSAAGTQRTLLRAALPWFESRSARTLAWWPDDATSRSVAAEAGMTFRQQERCSRVRVAELDDALLDEWTAAVDAQAAGYRLELWTGACPDELLDPYVAAYTAMNDAPLDEIDWTPEQYTAAIVRRSEEVAAARGVTVHAAVVVAPDGSGAGMTRIDVHPERPQLAHQEDTAVVPAHRGRRIGRWLKVANLRAVRERVPEVAIVETFNAESNPWMLDINVAMGFRPYRAYDAYQGPIGAVRDALG
ncbi:hypothetical protein [Actinomarinicola tropica]|uniref:N-acetyltransferase domain-containing protein n=1 Tax=Actinomarinicola tropica TaxID=2789776 RepID=A0A5Q2RMI0_9ACTN|nr:hypothetical protein [Actinomarinicola tropica]QGG96152.1 hypothetical protein GH723_14165 [Actinomarinicola tropica]